ncbi:MAG: Uma2 family endonuclease [Actinomycetota bacterium]|nr:Uma2 family endonuclease [Actinomycetota bacterium]
MSIHPVTPSTYHDYVELPDDGKRYEIVEGEIYVTPAANTHHQDIVGFVFVRLYQHVDRHGGGRVFVAPYDVVLSPTNVVQPDVLVVADADAGRITEANLQGPPTLAVEVLSDPRHDRVRKRALYATFGVKEYWIVDPIGERVEVHRLEGDRYPTPAILEAGDILATGVLPGLSIDVTALLTAGQ